VRRLQEVHHGLRDAEEHQADAHARGEEHRKPAQGAVFGLRVVRPELDVSEARQAEHQDADQDDGNDEHVVPAGVADDRVLQELEQVLAALRRQGRAEHRIKTRRRNM
jgi:hypothetical protein